MKNISIISIVIGLVALIALDYKIGLTVLAGLVLAGAAFFPLMYARRVGHND